MIAHAVFEIMFGHLNEDFTLMLAYPDGFPYVRPEVIPLQPRSVDARREPRFFSARHQLGSGMICLFERDPAEDPHAYVTGSAALRRACMWLRYTPRACR